VQPGTNDATGWPKDGNLVGKLRRKVSATGETYIELTDSSFIVEHHLDDPLHVSASTVRRDNLPLRERDGHTSALPLDERDNLAEPTHCVFFESNIVGVVRSLATPGHLKASSVLSKKTGIDLIFVPMLRPEIEAMVVGAGAVSSIELRIAGSSFDAQAATAGDPVEAVHRLTSQFSGGTEATVKISAPRNKAEQWRLKDWVVRHLESFGDNRTVRAAKVQLLDQDGERQLVDLLNDQITQSVTMNTQSVTRHPDAEEIREAIIAAFNANRDLLLRSIEVQSSQ
jgi:hypothetical protein